MHLLALLAILVAYWAATSRFGLGVSPDSVIYSLSAQNLALQLEYKFDGEPVTHFPIGYPLALAQLYTATGSIAAAAKALNLMSLTTLYVALYTILLSSGSPRKLACGMTALFLLSTPISTTALMLWSEPFCMALIWVGFAALTKWIKDGQNSTGNLIVIGLCLGTAITVRFAAAGLALGFYWSVFYFSIRSRRSPKFPLATLLITTVVPMIVAQPHIWTAHGDTVANRTFNVHWIGGQKVANLILVPMDWLVGYGQIPLPIVAAKSLAALALLAAALRRPLSATQVDNTSLRNLGAATSQSAAMVAFFYVAFLCISISFFDASTPVDVRIMAPIAPSILICGTHWISRHLSTNIARRKIAAFLAIALAAMPQSLLHLMNFHRSGMAYSGAYFSTFHDLFDNRSTQVDWSKPTYTNCRDFALHCGNDLALSLPHKYSKTSRANNTSFTEDMLRIRSDVVEGRSQILWIPSINRSYYMSLEEIESLFRELPDCSRTIHGGATLFSAPR